MKKILIVNANYYNDITKKLVNSAKKTLNNKFKIYVINVPGVFEIPIAIKKNIKKFDAFLAIGCVIKGKTPHFELICETSFKAIMNLMVNLGYSNLHRFDFNNNLKTYLKTIKSVNC